MNGDAPQVPVTQEVQPEAKEVPQAPQQPPAVSQTPPESTPPIKPKKWLIIGIIGIIIIILGAIGYFHFSGEKESVVDGEEQEILTEGKEWFQTENTQDITKFQTKLSKELLDSRLGSGSDLIADINSEHNVDGLIYQITEELGAKWARLIIDHGDWYVVEETGEYSKNYIDPKHDRVITELIDNDVRIMLVLVHWDEKINTDAWEGEGEYSRFTTEEEIQRYLDYVKFIASHFKDKIEYYEILNEPNHCEGTQQNVKIDDYINLVKRVVPVIRQEDPNAKIVAGAIADLRQPPFREYFFKLIKSDVMPLVDGISFHSMYGVSPGYDILKKYYYAYPSLIQEIKDTSSAHGFNGEYIMEELTYRTPLTTHPDESWIYSDKVAAKYYARGIIINLGLDLTTELGLQGLDVQPYIGKAIHNLYTVMAGNNPTDLLIEIESEATNIESYAFSVSNGDKLVALWTDGVAVDDDPGVRADLILGNSIIDEVVAIDVLNGYQQTLVADGNTIKDLIVKDYPLILRISKSN